MRCTFDAAWEFNQDLAWDMRSVTSNDYMLNNIRTRTCYQIECAVPPCESCVSGYIEYVCERLEDISGAGPDAGL